MTYSRIERGPMAADVVGRHFTQISNQVFRDARLSGLAMGVFGHISTHRDGFGITPEEISKYMRNGVSAIKGALRELERYGYLNRTRVRRQDGTLGPSIYKITDMPDGVTISADAPYPQAAAPTDGIQPQVLTCENSHNPRSEPAVEKPPVDSPPVENRSHKKNKEKNTSHKNTNEQKNPPPAVGELQVPTGARATAADAAESKDSRSRGKEPKQRDATPPVEAVRLYQRLPERLREHVPEHGYRRVLRVLAAELEQRTAAELAERIARRSEAWAYRTEDVKDATGVAITVVRRGYDCVDVRCEDHVRLDTGQPCTHCAANALAGAVTEAKTAGNSDGPASGTDDRYVTTGRAGTARPPWCGHCSKVTRQREDEDGRPYRCPDCHPLAAASATA